jgi:hypothetical protein
MPARGCGGAPRLEGLRQGRSQDLIEAGCRFLRQGRGDHEVWTSPHAPKPFTVPMNIASRHTANKVLKDAGLQKAF